MKTHLTVADMMLRLRIPQSNYTHFRNWCYKNKDKLDTQLCKWNNGYTLYNVELVREKYPFPERFGLDKVSTPEPVETPTETPLDAAERLAAAINTATGKNLTGAEVMEHCNRMYDYIRMRRTMARVLWRMHKERRACEVQVRACKWQEEECNYHQSNCYNTADIVDKRYRELRDNERVACRAAGITMILFVVFAITLLTHIFIS